MREFFDGDGAKEAAKLAALFQRFADYGIIANRLKFKKLQSDLFEFKGHQARLLCFPEGRTMVIVHGVIKKKDDLNPADVSRAARIRDDYRKSLTRKR